MYMENSKQIEKLLSLFVNKNIFIVFLEIMMF